MLSEDKYFRDLSKDELWKRYCGFLDLSIAEFMDMQKELLMDQIERVAGSLLGNKIMRNQRPQSVAEFRRMVPLTTYDDYEPYLSERQDDALAIKPQIWCHSAGRGGRFKWLPHGSEFLEKLIRNCLGCFILASATRRGEINISPGFRFLVMLAPAPYASGSLIQTLAQHFSFQSIPPLDTTETMEFQDRIRHGFQIALKDGVDIIGSLGSILAKMGEDFSGEARRTRFSVSMLHPKIMVRLLKARLHSKREKRPILPKDLWPAKAIVTSGVDTAIYKEEIARYWGSQPYEFYICAEAFFLSMQGYDKKGMVFLPDSVFLEFIPYESKTERHDDKDYQPPTVLLDEVEEGKLYEVVITHLYGMPLLRYRMRDIVKVVALRNEETGVNLPHIVFQHRVGEVINIAGLAQLDEKTIWQAVANTGIRYTDWTAYKEYERQQSYLRLYIELKEEREAAEVETLIDEQLRIVDTDYKDIALYLRIQPVRVTILSPGTFAQYTEEKRKEGADLAHLKPTHINASEAVTKRLVHLSDIIKEEP